MSVIYRDMSQAELDNQYNARGSVSDFDAEIDRYRKLSDSCYADMNVIENIFFGENPDEQIDLFLASDPNSPLFVFIHGGYWRALGRHESAFMAQTFVAQGISVAVVEYALAPAASLDQIVDQVRRAVVYLARNTKKFGYDRQQLFLGGSSAGAHLCAMALTPGWQPTYGLSADTVKGAVLASGLYDLEPVRLCKPNEWLRLDSNAARRNSPIELPMPIGMPLLITWGGKETGEFKRQSRDYAERARISGGTVIELEVEDRNHFDLIVDLADSNRRLCQTVLAMIKPGTSLRC
jgi:arylformamidase